MKIRNFIFLIILSFSLLPVFSWDLSDVTAGASDIFDIFYDGNQGRTAFRSLLVPSGGRAEALGGSFTALSDDICFFDYNPAASSDLTYTETGIFHNSWIGDSNLETIGWTSRKDNIGYGAQIRCFYVPFSEYDSFGEKVSKGYYTETVFTLNGSYTFFPGYYFNGVSLGMNIKGAYRGVPDYSDNQGNLIAGSGSKQSAFTFLVDTGIQIKFNFLKTFYSREKNAWWGMAVKNLGFPVKGESPPAQISTGFAWQVFTPVILALEIQQPLNLTDIREIEYPYLGMGLDFKFADFFSMQAGFMIKGGNPRISLGSQVQYKNVVYNLNYTLDLTTALVPFGRISVAATMNLGDKGRKEKAEKVDEIYLAGLSMYAEGNLAAAITTWQEALSIDPYYEPVKQCIETAEKTLELQKRIELVQTLE